jgi:hypothetical protein
LLGVVDQQPDGKSYVEVCVNKRKPHFGYGHLVQDGDIFLCDDGAINVDAYGLSEVVVAVGLETIVKGFAWGDQQNWVDFVGFFNH